MERKDRLTSEELKLTKAKKWFYRSWLLVAVGLVVWALGFVLNVLATPVGIIMWSTIIVFCLHGPVNWFESHGISRTVGTALAFVSLFVIIALLLWLLFSPMSGLSDQMKDLTQSLPVFIDSLKTSVNNLYANYSDLLQDERISTYINDAFASIGSWATQTAEYSAQNFLNIGSAVGNSMLVFGFSLVVSFWILIELPALGRECKRLIGESYATDANMLYMTFSRVMSGYIKGTVIQCAMIGIGCGIGFAIIGLPNPAALGLLTGILNIIPVVGPWLGGAVAAIVGIFVSPLIAIIALLIAIVVQQVVYTFISPKIMADSVDVHPALVILALVTGSAIGFAMSGAMGGFVGALLSIPFVAAIKSIFVYYFEKRSGRRIVAPDGVFFKGDTSSDDVVDPTADAIANRYIDPDSTGPLWIKRTLKQDKDSKHSSNRH